MKLIISILLLSTVTYASGANHKYSFVTADTNSSRSISSSGVISNSSLKGDFEKFEKTLCFGLALEKFINYSRMHPAYFSRLSTFKLEEEKIVAGAKNAIYSMDFIVSDKVVSMQATVNSLDGLCF